MKRTLKPQGFTLIELMVVIVIIGILAAIAVPKFMDASVKAKTSEIPTVLASYEHAELAYIAEKAGLSTSIGQLIFDSTSAANSKWFTYTYAATTAANTYTAAIKASTNLNNSLTEGKEVHTSVASTGAITHKSTSDSAAFVKYIPNFF
jgi:prepilin-type N-terminal cleavage/methylation domain-containing protein